MRYIRGMGVCTFTQEKANAICHRLASGESLRKAAAAENISPMTVLDWTERIEAFGLQYAQARVIGYRLLADEILEISDDSSGDVVETENGPKANAEFVARSRLRVDSRKWMLSKMLPKIYGDKTLWRVRKMNELDALNITLARLA